MAKISGKDGKVYHGSGPTELHVTNWSITKTISTKDVSDSSSSGGKDYIPDGLYDIEGSFEGFAESGTTIPTFGSEIALSLRLDGTGKWDGNGIITSQGESLQVSGGEAVKIPYSFKGTGAWTRTSP